MQPTDQQYGGFTYDTPNAAPAYPTQQPGMTAPPAEDGKAGNTTAVGSVGYGMAPPLYPDLSQQHPAQPVMPQYGQLPPAQPGQPGQPVMTQYGQQPGVVQQQYHMVVDDVNDNMVLSIVTMVLCCCPIGLVAVIKSLHCRRAKQEGDRAGAQRLANEAKKLAKIGIIIGIILIVINIIVQVVVRVVVVPGIVEQYTYNWWEDPNVWKWWPLFYDQSSF